MHNDLITKAIAMTRKLNIVWHRLCAHSSARAYA